MLRQRRGPGILHIRKRARNTEMTITAGMTVIAEMKDTGIATLITERSTADSKPALTGAKTTAAAGATRIQTIQNITATPIAATILTMGPSKLIGWGIARDSGADTPKTIAATTAGRKQQASCVGDKALRAIVAGAYFIASLGDKSKGEVKQWECQTDERSAGRLIRQREWQSRK
jgi:hypothetical protein